MDNSAIHKPYGTDKIVHHYKALQMLKDRCHQPPITIHFMPTLICNQHCNFCSYGHRVASDGPDQMGWKNMELMVNEYMPLDKLRECIGDWKLMGVKAVEITGGGEPLIYKYVNEFFDLMASWGADLALVTNGVALTGEKLDKFAATRWKWARVSIDAGDADTYVKTRRVPIKHWDMAWDAVKKLSSVKYDKEQHVGVGYIIDKSNYLGVYDACRLAKEFGADSIRVALALTPTHMERFVLNVVDIVSEQVSRACVDFPELQINNLVPERSNNLLEQDYSFCSVKEIICVVGGDQKLYTCCMQAFNKAGLIGSIRDRSFKEVWESDAADMFSCHDASKICKIPCLYESRNKKILELLSIPDNDIANLAVDKKKIHINFI